MLPRNVLVFSTDAALVERLRSSLAVHGLHVRHATWAPCCAVPTGAEQTPTDVVVADLDCPEPDCWRHATRLRRAFGSLPVVFLFHALPDEARLRAWRPSAYLRKPFAVDELLRVLRDLASVAAV